MAQAGSHLIKKIGEVDLDQLRDDLLYIPEQRQYPLQGKSKDDVNSAISTNTNYRNDEEEYTVRLYDDMLEYTYSIIEEYGLYRTRYMSLPSITCYGYHKDSSPRIHIPITTNENCFFLVDEQLIRLPADGSVYWVDTRYPHTFVNANPHVSKFTRIHLIGNTNKTFSF